MNKLLEFVGLPALTAALNKPQVKSAAAGQEFRVTTSVRVKLWGRKLRIALVGIVEGEPTQPPAP